MIRSRLPLAACAALLLAAAPAGAQVGIPQIPGMALDSTLLRFSPVSRLAAGLGFTTIDGGDEAGQFLLLQFQPEVDLGAVGLPDVGFGIDVPLRFQLSGGDDSTSAFRFRDEDYDDPNEVLAVLRYVRYGRKGGGQALYARFGSVDFGRVGFGTLVEAYRNEVGQDARRRGAEIDLDLGGAGVETLVGSFTRPGVYAARGFVRPFRLMGGQPGGLGDLTLGLTVAGDLDEQGGFVNTAAPGEPFALATTPGGGLTSQGIAGVDDQGALRAISIDVGLPVASNGLATVGLYANATTFSGQGAGGGAGLLVSITPPAALSTRLDARLEAVFTGEGYQPSYFNAFYEVERLLVVDSARVATATTPARAARYQSRRNTLAASPAAAGVIGQVSAVVLGLVRVDGRYQQLFDAGATGWAHVGADLLLPGNRAFLRAGLDRWNIGGDQATNTDAEGRTFSVQAEVGVQLTRYLLVGGIAQRAFAPVYADGRVVDFLRQDRVEPVVQFTLPF